MNLDEYIKDAFLIRWCGESVRTSLSEMKKQLHKNLDDQTKGYWSGHSAYGIMRDYGFLINEKHVNGNPKKLTKPGEMFMRDYEKAMQGDNSEEHF